jgi:hypothetical protein
VSLINFTYIASYFIATKKGQNCFHASKYKRPIRYLSHNLTSEDTSNQVPHLFYSKDRKEEMKERSKQPERKTTVCSKYIEIRNK